MSSPRIGMNMQQKMAPNQAPRLGTPIWFITFLIIIGVFLAVQLVSMVSNDGDATSLQGGGQGLGIGIGGGGNDGSGLDSSNGAGSVTGTVGASIGHNAFATQLELDKLRRENEQLKQDLQTVEGQKSGLVAASVANMESAATGNVVGGDAQVQHELQELRRKNAELTRNHDEQLAEFVRREKELHAQIASAQLSAQQQSSSTFLQSSSAAARAACNTWTDTRRRCVNRYVLLYDLWERLVNFRSAFINIVLIGKDVGFNVVVPFVHETKVQAGLHTPHHYLEKNMSVTTLGEYFSVPEMKKFGNVYEYEEWAEKAAKFVKGNQWRVVSVVSAIVVFYWDKDIPRPANAGSFWWCDESIQDVPNMPKVETISAEAAGTENYKALSSQVVYERRVCVAGHETEFMDDRGSQAQLEQLFAFVESGVTNKATVTLAFQNYRKYGWKNYVQVLRRKVDNRLSENYVTLSPKVLSFADSFKRRKMGGEDYIAIHFRAGRVMAHTQDYDTRGEYLKYWAFGCINSIQQKVDHWKAASMKPNMKVFVATDLLNDGMRGGEHPRGMHLRRALQEIKDRLFTAFGETVVLEQSDLDLIGSSDLMGMASLLDIGIAVRSVQFISMRDSFAKLVVHERTRLELRSDMFLCDWSETAAKSMVAENREGAGGNDGGNNFSGSGLEGSRTSGSSGRVRQRSRPMGGSTLDATRETGGEASGKTNTFDDQLSFR
eukprot:CAMPEP_0184695878 /NCGR_PEP_ID=MMETSP0313-20130426/3364_1 /TAXON_ID=2792 /ORGANISM="Porphyridium aerugineum, Strain SAG 1380-2" /LENGTH=718 /DNA_ID=CAMNT_0027154405 /DNA_START=321 /DNA_END=2477 /DNA_ORIENTATION=+